MSEASVLAATKDACITILPRTPTADRHILRTFASSFPKMTSAAVLASRVRELDLEAVGRDTFPMACVEHLAHYATRARNPGILHVTDGQVGNDMVLVPLDAAPPIGSHDQFRTMVGTLLEATLFLLHTHLAKGSFLDVQVLDVDNRVPLVFVHDRLLFPSSGVFKPSGRPGVVMSTLVHTLNAGLVYAPDPQSTSILRFVRSCMVSLGQWWDGHTDADLAEFEATNPCLHTLLPTRSAVYMQPPHELASLGIGAEGCVVWDHTRADQHVFKFPVNPDTLWHDLGPAVTVARARVDPEEAFTQAADPTPVRAVMATPEVAEGVNRVCVEAQRTMRVKLPRLMPMAGTEVGVDMLVQDVGAKGKGDMQSLMPSVTLQSLLPLFLGLVVFQAAGFPHHDIKPPNLLLVHDPRYVPFPDVFKYIDFSLSGMNMFTSPHVKDPTYSFWPPEHFTLFKDSRQLHHLGPYIREAREYLGVPRDIAADFAQGTLLGPPVDFQTAVLHAVSPWWDEKSPQPPNLRLLASAANVWGLGLTLCKLLTPGRAPRLEPRGPLSKLAYKMVHGDYQMRISASDAFRDYCAMYKTAFNTPPNLGPFPQVVAVLANVFGGDLFDLVQPLPDVYDLGLHGPTTPVQSLSEFVPTS